MKNFARPATGETCRAVVTAHHVHRGRNLNRVIEVVVQRAGPPLPHLHRHLRHVLDEARIVTGYPQVEPDIIRFNAHHTTPTPALPKILDRAAQSGRPLVATEDVKGVTDMDDQCRRLGQLANDVVVVELLDIAHDARGK